MKTMNKVELVGYLGKDPLISTTGKGNKKASLSIATDKFRRDDSGKLHRTVNWHAVVAWNKLAEHIENEYIKGSHIMVLGEILNRTYMDKTGHTRYIMEINALRIMNLDR